MNETAKPLTIFQKFFLAVIVPSFFLLLLEVICRIFSVPALLNPADSPMALEMPTWMMREASTHSKATRVKYDEKTVDWLNIFEEGPGFRVRLIPNIEKAISNTFSQIPYDREAEYLVKANSLGFRGDEVTPRRAPGTFRIMIFGDSSSFGWGVNQDETYASLLERKLGEHFPDRKIEVANFAIPGDSSEYGKLIFDAFVPEFESDLVIFGFGANDAKSVVQPHSQQVDSFRKQRSLQLLTFWARKSALYASVEGLLKRANPQARQVEAAPRRPTPAVARSRYRDNLSHMAQKALESGASQAMVLTLCTPAHYVRPARKLAAARNFMFLNGQGHLIKLLPEIMNGEIYPELVAEMRKNYGSDLKKNNLFYLTSDSCHPNKLGHQLVADEIARMIVDARLIK